MRDVRFDEWYIHMTACVDSLSFLSIIPLKFTGANNRVIARACFFDQISLFHLSYLTPRNLHDDLFYSIMLVWDSDRFLLAFVGVISSITPSSPEPLFMFFIVALEATGSMSGGYKWAGWKGSGELYVERRREGCCLLDSLVWICVLEQCMISWWEPNSGKSIL